MQLTLIKKAKDQNSNTTLSIYRSNEFSPVFFVDIHFNERLDARCAFNNFREALDKYYDLMDVGFRFNHYDFKPVQVIEGKVAK